MTIDTPARAVELGIAYVPEDRRRHGVILEMSVAANTTLATLRAVSTFGLLDFRRERAVAADFVRRLGVKTAVARRRRSATFRAATSRRWPWRAGWRPSRRS